MKYNLLKNQIGGSVYDFTTMNYRNFLNYVIANDKKIAHDYGISYFIEIKISESLKYNCIVNIDNIDNIDDTDFQIYFLNSHCNFSDLKENTKLIKDIDNMAFMQIFFSTGDSISTNFDFETIPGKNKLNTIMDLLEIIYKHFNKKNIELSDAATFSCNRFIEEKQPEKCIYDKIIINNYNAIIYRMLGTDANIDNISIYNRFNYSAYTEKYNKQILTELLNYIRNYQVGKLLELINRNKNVNINKILIEKLESVNPNMKIHDFFKSLNMNTYETCNNNFKYFEIMTPISNNHNIKLVDLSKPITDDDFFGAFRTLSNALASLTKTI